MGTRAGKSKKTFFSFFLNGSVHLSPLIARAPPENNNNQQQQQQQQQPAVPEDYENNNNDDEFFDMFDELNTLRQVEEARKQES
jgi:hypothetical protein